MYRCTMGNFPGVHHVFEGVWCLGDSGGVCAGGGCGGLGVGVGRRGNIYREVCRGARDSQGVQDWSRVNGVNLL